MKNEKSGNQNETHRITSTLVMKFNSEKGENSKIKQLYRDLK